MAHYQRSHMEGPQSSQGNAALNSIITQFKTQIRSLESKHQNLEKENQNLKQELRMARSNPEKPFQFYRNLPDEREFRHSAPEKQDLYVSDHRFATPFTVSENEKKTESPSEPGISQDAFISGIIGEESLSHSTEVKQKFKDLASLVSENLAHVGDLRKGERQLEAKLEYSKKTIASLLQFLSILHIICLSSGCGSGEDLPSWLGLITENVVLGSSSIMLVKLWRLLQWNLHHCHEEKPSVLTQGLIDEWYTSKKDQGDIHGVERTLSKLYAEMCAYSNVSEEEEGLALSILTDVDNSSDDAASVDSSLSSKIPAQDLFTFKSVMQGLVEKFEDLYSQVTRLRSQVGHDSDADEMENDMYLPQREALETYDLGKLIQTMNLVIETLSLKLRALSAQRTLCLRCQQETSSEAGQGMNAFHPDQGKTRVQHFGFVSSIPPYSLHSKEAVPEVRDTQHFLVPPFSTSGVISTMAGRPNPGTFLGATGPLPRRTLTVLQNSSPLVRSQSDVSPVHPRKRELADNLPPRPSSLDSAFPSRKTLQSTTVPLGRYNLQSSGRIYESDSDEDYEVRGPPDTPPEVRAMHVLRKDGRKISTTSGSTTAPVMRGGHIHQKSDDSGLDLTAEGFTASQRRAPEVHPESQALKDVLRMPYSQVQQCTGDNSNTIQDMLLPSSVEWSTVQLKGGGIKAPTPEAMSRFSSSMNMAEQSIHNHQCVICHKKFTLSESQGVIYDHIQGHLHPSSSPDSSLVTLTGEGLETDGMLDRYTVGNSLEDRSGVSKCPVCNTVFPSYVTMKARESHINLHFEDEAPGFEVINEEYNMKK